MSLRTIFYSIIWYNCATTTLFANKASQRILVRESIECRSLLMIAILGNCVTFYWVDKEIASFNYLIDKQISYFLKSESRGRYFLFCKWAVPNCSQLFPTVPNYFCAANHFIKLALIIKLHYFDPFKPSVAQPHTYSRINTI